MTKDNLLFEVRQTLRFKYTDKLVLGIQRFSIPQYFSAISVQRKYAGTIFQIIRKMMAMTRVAHISIKQRRGQAYSQNPRCVKKVKVNDFIWALYNIDYIARENGKNRKFPTMTSEKLFHWHHDNQW